MPDVFGIEGGGNPADRNQNQGAAKNPRKGEEGLLTGEGAEGRYMQYDNEAGAMILNIPPHLAEFKGDLQEDLMDAFYGEAAGGKEMHTSIDAWIANWIEEKTAEQAERNRR